MCFIKRALPNNSVILCYWRIADVTRKVLGSHLNGRGKFTTRSKSAFCYYSLHLLFEVLCMYNMHNYMNVCCCCCSNTFHFNGVNAYVRACVGGLAWEGMLSNNVSSSELSRQKKIMFVCQTSTTS